MFFCSNLFEIDFYLNLSTKIISNQNDDQLIDEMVMCDFILLNEYQ